MKQSTQCAAKITVGVDQRSVQVPPELPASLRIATPTQ
jgi:hypothetical protein